MQQKHQDRERRNKSKSQDKVQHYKVAIANLLKSKVNGNIEDELSRSVDLINSHYGPKNQNTMESRNFSSLGPNNIYGQSLNQNSIEKKFWKTKTSQQP